MKTYEARVKLAGAGTQIVRINADDYTRAKAMLEVQFGRGSVVSLREA